MASVRSSLSRRARAMVRAICETSSVWVSRVRYRSPSGERNTCVFCLSRRKALQCSTRSRSRWNTGLIGSCSSCTILPLLWSLKVAHGAKAIRSISSVRCRTFIQDPLLFSAFPLSASAQPIPIAAPAAIVTHPVCRRGKYPVVSQNFARFFKSPLIDTVFIKRVRRKVPRHGPVLRPGSAPAAAPAAGLPCAPASASTESRGP